MRKLKKHIIVFICFVAVALTAFSQQKHSASSPANTNILTENSQQYFSQVFGFKVPDMFNCTLYDTISEWLGTPYRYSGKNENGIDCSSFVNMLYHNVFGIDLTGCAIDLFNTTKHLSKKKLKEGDLVFFKIDRHRISHVGIYLGENKFVHSSASLGVTINDLDEPYYKKYFSGGGRVH